MIIYRAYISACLIGKLPIKLPLIFKRRNRACARVGKIMQDSSSIVIKRRNRAIISKVICYFLIIVKCLYRGISIIGKLGNSRIIFYFCNTPAVIDFI